MHSRNSGYNLEDALTEGDNDWCVSLEEDRTKTVTLLPLIMA